MRKKMSVEDFEKECSIVHSNKYTYHQDYTGSNSKIAITCPVHGDFYQVACKHKSGIGCQRCAMQKARKGKIKYLERFEEECDIVHNNKFTYQQDYTGATKKVRITCPIHGDFYQRAADHLGGSGCMKCGHDLSSKSLVQPIEEFEKRAARIHKNKYAYHQDYVHSAKRVKITCPGHGDFYQIAHTHLLGSGCPKCAALRRGKALSVEQFEEACAVMHKGKYIYHQDFTNSQSDIRVTCPEHGDFRINASRHKHQRQGCPVCLELEKGCIVEYNGKRFKYRVKCTKCKSPKTTLKVGKETLTHVCRVCGYSQIMEEG